VRGSDNKHNTVFWEGKNLHTVEKRVPDVAHSVKAYCMVLSLFVKNNIAATV
jgi:hypothetical protein